MTKNLVIIFAKLPVIGKVKTRLIGQYTAYKACQIYKLLLLKTLKTVCSDDAWETYLLISPDETHPFIERLKSQYPFTCHGQKGASLGERIINAYDDIAMQYQKVVIIGADCPTLTSSHIKQSFDLLSQYDVVITPAEDGGYTHMAMNQLYPQAFQDIDWGTKRVLQQTLQQLDSLNIQVSLMKPHYDIDVANDLKRYVLTHAEEVNETLMEYRKL